MTKEELNRLILDAINDYLSNEEAFDDNAQLCIAPGIWRVYAADSREIDPDDPAIDCYDILDFVEMSPDGPEAGHWIPNPDLTLAVASDYQHDGVS